MSCLFREQLKRLFLGAGDDLWTVAFGTIENKMICLIVIFEAFWYTFHPFVVFTDRNTVSFINKMQNKKSQINEIGINIARIQSDYKTY